MAGHALRTLQVRILTSPLCELDDKCNGLKQKKNLVEGLKALSSRDDILVKGHMRHDLYDIYDRMFPQQKRGAAQ